MQAFLLTKTGSYKNLELKNIPDPIPQADEVLIRHNAIGINHFDICFRNGFYKLSQTPAILGLEGCGIIEEVGKNVIDYKVGERVAYCTGPIGSYSEKRAIKQNLLIVPPKSLSDEVIVGSLLKGMMAHTLLFRVYLASRIKTILIHSVAGGVGHLLCQWARHLGINVIGTIGSDAKIAPAKSFGCNHVINRNSQDFLNEVDKITNGEGVGLVYDSIGLETILKSIDCLWPMGMCISYGESSGATPEINLNTLLLNSLYITRPTLAMYKAKRIELVLSANEVLQSVEKGILRPNITRYKFTDLPQAHRDLESASTIGSLVVKF